MRALARLKVQLHAETLFVLVLQVLPEFSFIVGLPYVIDAPVDGSLEGERTHDDSEGERRRPFRHASVESARQRHGSAFPRSTISFGIWMEHRALLLSPC